MFRKFEKVTMQWIKLSTFRATDPRKIQGCLETPRLLLVLNMMFSLVRYDVEQ